MKMKKLFAGLVATSMIAAGTSAFAAVNEYALNPTVDEKTGVAKISEADVAKLDDYANTQMTVLIIPEAAYNKLTDDDDETNITDDDIYYIDQMAANDTNLFQKMGLKCGADLIPEGETSATYYVRVGGAYDINDGIYEGSFTVTKTAAGTTYWYGDVDGTYAGDDSYGEADIDDAMEIVFYYNYMPSVFDDAAEWRFIAGNVDGIGEEPDIDDAMEIVFAYNYMPSVFDNMESRSFVK